MHDKVISTEPPLMNTFLDLLRGLANLIEVLLDFVLVPFRYQMEGRREVFPADHLDKLEATRLGDIERLD